MSYFCKGEDVDLMERDLVMISGLSHLDARVQGSKDYPEDPFTKVVERNCPNCGYYMRKFPKKLMVSQDLSQ